MATGGENLFDFGSEDFDTVVCDLCQTHNKPVGMCIDYNYYLCKKCFVECNISDPFLEYKAFDEEAMPHAKDKCTEKCPAQCHDNRAIEYHCINHSYLGCSVCLFDHHFECASTNVRYIPEETKNLANNVEYQQAERRLISVLKMSKNVTQANKQNIESLKKDCSEATEMVHKLNRKSINEDTVGSDFIQQYETITEKIAQIVDIFETTQTELYELINMKDSYQNNNQNCNLYILLMKTTDKVKLAEERMKEAEKELSNVNCQIKLVASFKEILSTLKLPEKLLKPGTPRPIRPDNTENTVSHRKQTKSVKKAETKRIVITQYVQEINVKCKNDKGKHTTLTGSVVLPNNRLVTTDYFNENVKLVDVKNSQVITCLTPSLAPYDVTMVTNMHVVITMPNDKKVAFVNVTATGMTVDRTLGVNGAGYGVDYRDGKLAVSFRNPDKVEVITLQGRVLHSITTDQQGHNLFNKPYYVIFGQDNTSLYVSNYYSNNVVNVKFDGTVVGIYTDSKLSGPQALLTGSSGHVYVCGYCSHNIHQITQGCRKVHVFLNRFDGLCMPQCISYSEIDCRLYTGLWENDVVTVYKLMLCDVEI